MLPFRLAVCLLLLGLAPSWAARTTAPPMLNMGDLQLPMLPGASIAFQYTASREILLNLPVGGDTQSLKGIESLSLVVLKVTSADLKPAQALVWYDRRVRAAGWPPKLRRPQVAPQEASAIYQKPKKGLLVLDISRRSPKEWEVQLVYVKGDINASEFGNAFGAAPRKPTQRSG